MQKLNRLFQFIRGQPRWRLAAAAVLVLAGLALLWRGGARSGKDVPTFVARRGPLEINVLEGGNLQALESQEVKCEVRVGYQGTKILKIVDEGYLVTEEDVRTNKVLVELDGSDLQKQIIQQEIQFQSALASLIDAQQSYEIQLNQNDTDIKAAEQKARFARLDFDKFLGETVTTKLIAEVGLDRMLAAASTNDVEHTARAEAAFGETPGPTTGRPGPGPAGGGPEPGTGGATLRPAVLRSTNATAVVMPPAVGVTNAALLAKTGAGNGAGENGAAAPETDQETADEAEFTNSIVVDFSQYAKLEALGDGEAKQKLRQFEDSFQVSQKELGQSKSTLEGTQRLFEKGFVTKTDLQRDEIAFENSRLKVQTAQSARDLFLQYDFLKSAEESLSKYADAVRDLDKARRVAISKKAQARARLKSAQGQYQVQSRQRSDLNEQLEKCTIRAKKSGLVVYGGARDDMYYYGGEERIREGASVRERQAIITIPDMSRMSVNVKIHESYIKKIKKGQKARITVDAFPDKVLTGEVTKVGVLPDSQNRWMNPDMKVYLTTITLDSTQDWVKPGMSAKVEILVNRIDNCVYVPVQAVAPDGDKQVCYLASGFQRERREVEVGDFNDEFIEIRKGLKEGDRVLLQAPEITPEKPAEETKPEEGDKRGPAAAPAAAPAQPRPEPAAAKSRKA